MTIAEYSNLFDLIWKIIGALASMIAIIWALHKFYLINTFLTKKEFRHAQLELENRIEKKIEKGFEPLVKQIEKTTSLEKDFAIFKATYMGDTALIKERMKHANDVNKQILHRVNNMASQDLKAIIQDVLIGKKQ